jgi:hypothetical protein
MRYARVIVKTPHTVPAQGLQLKTVIFRQNPAMPSGLTSALKHCFHIQRSDSYGLPLTFFFSKLLP